MRRQLFVVITCFAAIAALTLAGCHSGNKEIIPVTPEVPTKLELQTVVGLAGARVLVTALATASQAISGAEVSITFDPSVVSLDLSALPDGDQGPFYMRSSVDQNSIRLVLVAKEGASMLNTALLAVPFYIRAGVAPGDIALRANATFWNSDARIVGEPIISYGKITVVPF
jgi:hypothetical protein